MDLILGAIVIIVAALSIDGWVARRRERKRIAAQTIDREKLARYDMPDDEFTPRLKRKKIHIHRDRAS